MALTTNELFSRIKPSQIREFDELFRSVEGCIPMTIGEPDFDMPENVKRAAIKAIEDNASHYAHTSGEIGVRKAVSEFLEKQYNLHYDPETEIVMTVGATEGLFAAAFGLLNPGDQVIIPSPFFPLYSYAVELNRGECILVDTSDTGFLMTPELLHKTMAENKNVKALFLNYPSNPTGATYTKDELIALADAIKQYDIFVLSDEIYSEITYGEKHTSIATLLRDRTILFQGASKAFAMTGWRVGVLAADAKWMKTLFLAHQQLVTTGVTVSNRAAEEAFRNSAPDVEKMRSEYEKRRNILVPALQEAGFEVPALKGAFYAFAKIPAKFGTDDKAFCREIGMNAKVGMLPGSIFGPGGEGYVRMSYALSTEMVAEAGERLKTYIASK